MLTVNGDQLTLQSFWILYCCPPIVSTALSSPSHPPMVTSLMSTTPWSSGPKLVGNPKPAAISHTRTEFQLWMCQKHENLLKTTIFVYCNNSQYFCNSYILRCHSFPKFSLNKKQRGFSGARRLIFIINSKNFKPHENDPQINKIRCIQFLL